MESCDFDYSTPEAQRALSTVIDQVLVIREQLSDPSQARSVGIYEKAYEWSLGLAVIPVLVGRAVALVASGPKAKAPEDPTGLVAELRQELLVDAAERKMKLYEYSLGLAVVPVLTRRAFYKIRYAMRRLPG